MILKCKMCGGDMEYTQDVSVMECPYCGTNQTLPKVDNERLAQMHSRANHLRLLKEFDKAQMIYEEIIAENPKDAEAHWCALLCRYGIEYVEDPYSRERKPTMHRTQFDAITEDAHYLSAVEHADSIAREMYEHEAQLIDRIRRRYLSIASKEEPFDVFICYKETGENGQRTTDSVYAQEIYNELTREGYKVFFARITLEDKLGEAYEPYIFAALGSAKVMLVVSTSAAHMQAEWVKNEWKRYLYLMKQDGKKKLIPVYRDMEAYDMPEEFVYMQAQDYGKIGALQDLVRGVDKIVGKKQAAQAVQQVVQQTVVQQQGAGVDSLMERAMLFLEDGDFKSAKEYLDRVLDINPKYAPAYFGKVMAKYAVRREEQFAESDCMRDSQFENEPDWQKAVRFAGNAQRGIYDGYLACVQQRRREKVENERKAKEEARIRQLLDSAQQKFNTSKTIEEYSNVKYLLDRIHEDSRAQKLIAECDEKIEELHSVAYSDAVNAMRKANSSEEFCEAKQKFEQLGDYRNSKKLVKECEEGSNNAEYTEALTAMQNASSAEEFHEAGQRFSQLGGYRDSKKLAQECEERSNNVAYTVASDVMHNANSIEEFYEAGQMFRALGSYRDSKARVAECEEKEEEAKRAEKERKEAERRAEEERREQQRMIAERNKQIAAKKAKMRNVLVAVVCVSIISLIGVYLKVIYPMMKYQEAEKLLAEGKYATAKRVFEKLSWDFDYRDSSERVKETAYSFAEVLLEDGLYDFASEDITILDEWDELDDRECAAEFFGEAGKYRDAEERRIETYFMTAEEAIKQGEKFRAVLLYRKSKTAEGKQKANELMVLGKLAAGEKNTVGLAANGSIISAGRVKMRNPDGWNNIVSIAAAGDNIVAAKADGTLVAVGNFYGWNTMSSWTDITQVAIGINHTVGLRADGTVVANGKNAHGECDVGEWNDIVSIAAGVYHTVGLKSDGTVVATGINDLGMCDVDGWKDIVEIAVGKQHTVGLRADGTVVARGDNKNNQCEVSSSMRGSVYMENIVAIAAGDLHTVGLKTDGTVVAVGNNEYGQCNVGDWIDIVAVAAGEGFTLGIKADGTVIATGNNQYGQCDVKGWDLLN